MSLQLRLDLGSRDVLAAHFEHVLDTTVEQDGPGGIERANVAGVEPAVGIERLGGLLGVAVIPFEQAVAAHQHFATRPERLIGACGVDHAHLEARQRTPEAGDALALWLRG